MTGDTLWLKKHSKSESKGSFNFLNLFQLMLQKTIFRE